MPKPIAPLFQELLLARGVIKDQVYHALRQAILDGRLSAGSKIPSSRALAEMMAISRNSVIAGFDRLMDEGYLVTRKGAGTFVCEHIPDNFISEYDASTPPETAIAAAGPLNPDVAALVSSWSEREDSGEMRQVFAVGIGCTDLFPHALWGGCWGASGGNRVVSWERTPRPMDINLYARRLVAIFRRRAASIATKIG